MKRIGENWPVIALMVGVIGVLLAGTSMDPFAEPTPTPPAARAVEPATAEAVEVVKVTPTDPETLYGSACQDLLRDPDSSDPEKGCFLWKATCLHNGHIFNCLREEILESYTPTPAAQASPAVELTPTPTPEPTPEPTAEASSASGLTDEEIEAKAAEYRGDLVGGAAALVAAVALFRWILPALRGLLGGGRRKRRR